MSQSHQVDARVLSARAGVPNGRGRPGEYATKRPISMRLFRETDFSCRPPDRYSVCIHGICVNDLTTHAHAHLRRCRRRSSRPLTASPRTRGTLTGQVGHWTVGAPVTFRLGRTCCDHSPCAPLTHYMPSKFHHRAGALAQQQRADHFRELPGTHVRVAPEDQAHGGMTRKACSTALS